MNKESGCPFGADENCPNPEYLDNIHSNTALIIRHAHQVHKYNNKWLEEHGYIRTKKITISLEAYNLLKKKHNDNVTFIATNTGGMSLPISTMAGSIGYWASKAIVEAYGEKPLQSIEKEPDAERSED